MDAGEKAYLRSRALTEERCARLAATPAAARAHAALAAAYRARTEPASIAPVPLGAAFN